MNSGKPICANKTALKAAIIADLLTHVWLAADGAPIIEEALDYLATARREHPSQPITPTVAEWLDATLSEIAPQR